MSWTHDGITRRAIFRDCPHPAILEGRCVECRAKHVGDFVQVQSNAGHGGTPIGSPYLVQPKLIGTVMKAGVEKISKEVYNRPAVRRKPHAYNRKAA